MFLGGLVNGKASLYVVRALAEIQLLNEIAFYSLVKVQMLFITRIVVDLWQMHIHQNNSSSFRYLLGIDDKLSRAVILVAMHIS